MLVLGRAQCYRPCTTLQAQTIPLSSATACIESTGFRSRTEEVTRCREHRRRAGRKARAHHVQIPPPCTFAGLSRASDGGDEHTAACLTARWRQVCLPFTLPPSSHRFLAHTLCRAHTSALSMRNSAACHAPSCEHQNCVQASWRSTLPRTTAWQAAAGRTPFSMRF